MAIVNSFRLFDQQTCTSSHSSLNVNFCSRSIYTTEGGERHGPLGVLQGIQGGRNKGSVPFICAPPCCVPSPFCCAPTLPSHPGRSPCICCSCWSIGRCIKYQLPKQKTPTILTRLWSGSLYIPVSSPRTLRWETVYDFSAPSTQARDQTMSHTVLKIKTKYTNINKNLIFFSHINYTKCSLTIFCLNYLFEFISISPS